MGKTTLSTIKINRALLAASLLLPPRLPEAIYKRLPKIFVTVKITAAAP